jgi:hypothetical protein
MHFSRGHSGDSSTPSSPLLPCPAGLGQERTALRSRVDVLTAELTAAREGSADLRLRLDHFTGPGGPQARVKQLEAALQLVSLADM